MLAVLLVFTMISIGFSAVVPKSKAVMVDNTDEFGYVWIDSNSPNPTTGYNWVEISGTGTDIGLTGDNFWANRPLGFNFTFYGNRYTTVNISSNGYLDFGNDHTDSSNDNIPDTLNPNNYIAPFWDDLESGAGTIYFETIGTAPNRQFVVEWENWQIDSGNQGPMTFEALLNETGEIWFQYHSLGSASSSSATVGIENIDGTDGLLYSYNTPSITDNLAIMFYVPEHPYEIAVKNFQAPDYAVTGSPIFVNATIQNRGDFNESGIEVNLNINGVLGNQTIISSLASGNITNVSFLWSPPGESTYGVEISVTPISGETFIVNNRRSKDVTAYVPNGFLLIDEAHGNWVADYEDFIQDLFDQKYWLNHTTDPLNSALLANHDALISIWPQISYSAAELVDIMDFLNNTGGMMVIGGTDQNVLNGLTDYSGITWNGPRASSYWTTTSNIEQHPTTEGIASVYYTDHAFSIETSGTAEGVVYDNAHSTIQGAASTYNYGKVFAVNSRYDFYNWGLSNADNLQYSRNIVSWILTPPDDHDLAVAGFNAPEYAITGKGINITATIVNNGLNTESNVFVNFTVNGVLNSSISYSSLVPTEQVNVDFPWTPPADGSYSLGIDVTVVPGENYTPDNSRSINTYAYQPTDFLLIDRGHNNYLRGCDDFIHDQINQKYWVNYTSDPLNSTLLANHDALISIRPYNSYSAVELVDIRNFLNNTGGMLVLGGSSHSVLNGLTDYTEITWNGPQADSYNTNTNNINPHPTTDGVNSVHYSYHLFSIETSGAAAGVVYDNRDVTIQGAASNYHLGKVFAVNGREDFENGRLTNADNLQYSRNIISWLLTPPEDHDLAITNMSAPRYAIPGTTIDVNATVLNNGLNPENDIWVNLTVNGSVESSFYIASIVSTGQVNVNFSWTPPAEGDYDVEIVVTVVPGETNMVDNSKSQSLRAYYPDAFLLVDQAHDNYMSGYGDFIQDQWDHKYWLNYTNDPLDAAMLANHDVFISIGPQSSYSVAEISDIRDFLNNTGGMLAIGGTDQAVLNGLTDYSGITWNGMQANNYYTTTTNIYSHPTTAGINAYYYMYHSFSITIAGNATGVVYDDADVTIQGAASNYNYGKVFAVNGREDFGYALTRDDNLQYSRNIVEWLTMPLADHDMAITRFNSPDETRAETPLNINATVLNNGLNTETNLMVNFTVDGTLVESINITSVTAQDFVNVNFSWAPPADGYYTLEIDVTIVPGEGNIINNKETKVIYAWYPDAYLLVDQAHNNLIDNYEDFINDQYNQRCDVNYTSDPLNSTILANHDALISIRPQSSYSAAELSDIRDFLNNTGSMLVIGGSSQWILNDLTDYSGITWNGPRADNYWTNTNNINPHPTTSGINSVYYSYHWFSIETAGMATGVVYDDRDVTIQGAASTYNYGKVFAVNARYDFENGRLTNADNLQYSRNIISWLISPPEDHDLAVTNVSIPKYAIPGDSKNITATVLNAGLNAENGIWANLTVDGSLVSSLPIASIAPLEQVDVNFSWTPPAEGDYNIKINVTVVPGETVTIDNSWTGEIKAYNPTAFLLIDLAHNNRMEDMGGFIQDQIDQKYWVNYTSDPLNSTILANHEVLISIRPQNGYSAAELVDIKDFLNNRGGMMVIGGTNQNVLNGLTDYSGITWNGPRADNDYTTTTNIDPHSTTSGINSVYYSYHWFSIETAGAATGVVFDDSDMTIQGAASTYNYGKVFAVNGRDDFETWQLTQADNLQYSRNIVSWLLTPPENHDLAITNMTVPRYAIPGTPTDITATVLNAGLNTENGIWANLTVDGSVVSSFPIASMAPLERVDVDFSWTPPAEGNYNIKIDVSVVPGETVTIDNSKTTGIHAYNPTAFLLIDMAHNNRMEDMGGFIQDQTDQKYWVNYTSNPLNSTILANHDALISIRPRNGYSAAELVDIKDFLNNTGGMLVISGNSQWVLNGLTDYTGITWNGPQADNYYTNTNNINPHPTTDDVNSVYYSYHSFSIETAGAATGVVYDDSNATIQGAASIYSHGKVFAVNGRDDFENGRLTNADNLQYSRNIVKWLLNRIDVDGQSLAPPGVQRSQTNIPMLALDFSAISVSESTNLESLTVRLTGTATDSDIVSVKLYHDADGDMVLSPPDYQVGTTRNFSSGTATFSSLNYPLDDSIKTLLVVYEISWNATLSATAGCEIADEGDIILEHPYSATSFTPISSDLSLIMADTTIPPRVQEISAISADTGISRTTNLTIKFSEPMNIMSVEGNTSISEGHAFINPVWNEMNTTVVFEIDPVLSYYIDYTVTLNGSAVMDIDGLTLDGNGNGTSEGSPEDDYSWSFTTELAPDSTPPASEAESLPIYTTQTAFSVSFTSEDPTISGQTHSGLNETELWYKKDNGDWTLYGTFKDSSASFDTSTTGGDGKYQFYTIARDKADNEEAAPSGNDTWTIVDTVAPESSVNSLATYTTTSSITVTAAASDQNNIEKVELWYRIDGGIWVKLSTDNTAPYSWNLDKSEFDDGFYEFYTRAYDVPGNYEAAPASPDTSTTYDTTLPTASVTPMGDDITIDTNITVRFSEAVNRTHAENAFLISPTTAGSYAWNDAGTVMYFVPSSSLNYGTEYTVNINATGVQDIAGNHMASDQARNFTTESTPPLETGTVEGRIVDGNGTGIPGATITLEGTPYTATTDENGNYTITDVPPGDYTLLAEKDGYETETMPVEVSPNQVTAVPVLELPPSETLQQFPILVLMIVILAAIIGAAFMIWHFGKKKANNISEMPESEDPESSDEHMPGQERSSTEQTEDEGDLPPPPPPIDG